MNFYNEHDPRAAAWLRELVRAGLIPAGVVDERDIKDITPNELSRYTQCHFFAGIGGGPLALRLAGWPDDRPVWTGSCPCQPFSAAGAGAGFDDERHLWPHWHYLIDQCRPGTVFGEQVASKDGLSWLDLVHDDLAATHYAFGAFDLCAASVGAPHIRQRLWFVADSDKQRPQHQHGVVAGPGRGEARAARSDSDGGIGRLADLHGGATGLGRSGAGADRTGVSPGPVADGRGGAGLVADSGSARLEGCDVGTLGRQREAAERGSSAGGLGDTGRPGPAHVDWRNADWLLCRDAKWRPVEPGTFPLGHGLPARVGRLRGFGNAIVPEVAATFIRSYLDVTQ